MEVPPSSAMTFKIILFHSLANIQAGQTATLKSNLPTLVNLRVTSTTNFFFIRLKDACVLLRLPRPITLLLLDTLAVALQDDASSSLIASRALANGKQALKDQGVRKLSVEDALSVLRRRIL